MHADGRRGADEGGGYCRAVPQVASELLFEPKEMTVYAKALERVQADKRVQLRLGTPVTGYGSEGRSRSARQHVRHRHYHGPDALAHTAVQFYARGPNGNASVNVDMYQEGSEWKFQYLYLEMNTGSRIVLETPP